MKTFSAFLIFFHLSCVFSHKRAVSYEGYRLYNVHNSAGIPRNDSLLQQLRLPEAPRRNESYLVPGSLEKEFLRLLNEAGASFKLVVPDMGEVIVRNDIINRRLASRRSSSYSHEVYHSYSEMLGYLQSIQSIRNPKTQESLLQLENIGKSYENVDIYMAKVSSNHSAERPVILFEAGMHAREWVGPSSAMYFLSQLVENYTNFKDLLDNIDIFVIPVLNPDGYEYSRKHDRLWRKTRSNKDGVDPNRNFDIHWGETGTSTDPTDQAYGGPFPFSEKETVALRDVGIKYKSRLKAYVSIHTYGAMILCPWNFESLEPVPYSKEILANANAASIAIKNYGGTEYVVGTGTEILYPATGGSDDFFKAKLGVPLTYTIELSSGRVNTFMVPGDELLPILKETAVGFESLASSASAFR